MSVPLGRMSNASPHSPVRQPFDSYMSLNSAADNSPMNLLSTDELKAGPPSISLDARARPSLKRRTLRGGQWHSIGPLPSLSSSIYDFLSLYVVKAIWIVARPIEETVQLI